MKKRIPIKIIAILVCLALAAGGLVWFFCTRNEKTAFVPGLYETGALALYEQGKVDDISDMLILSWDELLASEVLYFRGGHLYTEYTIENELLCNAGASVLSGDLILPNDGTITSLGSTSAKGRTAFAGCTNLTGIYIPDSVSQLCDSAFYGCSALNYVRFPMDCQIKSLPSGCFRNCSALSAIRIPDSVEIIEEDAFMDCTALRQVTFGQYCAISYIRRNAFSGCASLTQFTLPASLKLVNSPQFTGCDNLQTVEFLAPLSINDSLFSTTSIKTIIFNCDPPQFQSKSFGGLTVTVYYPAENTKWQPEMCKNYGGNATWLPLEN